MQQSDEEELATFLSTRTGTKFLQLIISSANMVIHYGHGGIRSVQEFIKLAKLDPFVASSEGALQEYNVRCEEHFIAFGTHEENQMSTKMKRKKITAGLDELFRGRRPCLVAMEVVSGYILLEKFTEDRKAETWKKELEPRLQEANLELDQVVSDLCGGIRACAEDMGAKHVPELFHAQFEISKATSAALSSQEKACAKAEEKSKQQLQKILKKFGEKSEEGEPATADRNLRQLGHKNARERREKVQTAKKELGKILHPINLETGKLQTTEIVKDRIKEQLTTINQCATEADLSQSTMERLEKAGRAFDAILVYVAYFFNWYRAFVNGLSLENEGALFFDKVVFPLCYLKMIWRRLPRKQKEELLPLKAQLESEFQAAQYSESEKKNFMEKGKECAEKFQRSSSCVEGRNGKLSLYHHRFCRLGARSTKALTVVHNFHKRQSDGTTAAERLFGNSHANLFESLVENVRIPGKPQKQCHDAEKRQLGWEKRRFNKQQQSAA